MSCPSCGADARGRFCTRCGARVIQSEKQSSQESFLDMIDRTGVDVTFDLAEMDVQGLLAHASYDGLSHEMPRAGLMVAEPPVSRSVEGEVGPSEALVRTSASPASIPGRYPVQVAFELPSSSKRLWAVPIVGFLAKAIVLVPHVLALAALTCVILPLQLVLWVPVLFRGAYPEWGFALLRGHLSWLARVMAFSYGLTDRYPTFGLGGGETGETPYPVTVMIDPPSTPKRFWAIPIVGYVVKSVVVLPHLVLLYALGTAVAVMQLGLWIPTLFTGRYPDWGYSIVAGYLRWSTRVAAYFFGLTDRYPPFQFNS